MSLAKSGEQSVYNNTSFPVVWKTLVQTKHSKTASITTNEPIPIRLYWHPWPPSDQIDPSQYMVVLADRILKLGIATFTSKITPISITKICANDWLLYPGSRSTFLTDNIPQLTFKFFRKMFTKVGIVPLTTAYYCSKSSGQEEKWALQLCQCFTTTWQTINVISRVFLCYWRMQIISKCTMRGSCPCSSSSWFVNCRAQQPRQQFPRYRI